MEFICNFEFSSSHIEKKKQRKLSIIYLISVSKILTFRHILNIKYELFYHILSLKSEVYFALNNSLQFGLTIFEIRSNPMWLEQYGVWMVQVQSIANGILILVFHDYFSYERFQGIFSIPLMLMLIFLNKQWI